MIFISNDDGINAVGLHRLVDVARQFDDVVVAAPAVEQSAKSHSMTVMQSLKVEEYKGDVEALRASNVRAYAVHGTPVECVKLSFHALLTEKPRLVLSGINHGSNTAMSVHYSGTLAVAREAALLGCLGIGLSQCEAFIKPKESDFDGAVFVARQVIKDALEGKYSQAGGVFYSVNVPGNVAEPELREAKLAMGFWREEAHKVVDPWGGVHYYLDGEFVHTDPEVEDCDLNLLDKGFATITKVNTQVTA